jgi:hypothetical protein
MAGLKTEFDKGELRRYEGGADASGVPVLTTPTPSPEAEETPIPPEE